jgi:acetyltransferase-like isoleucine patch superfamily enzyme
MKKLIRIILSCFLFPYAVKEYGVIIKKSKISRTGVYLYKNVIIVKSVIKDYVKIYPDVKLNSVILNGYNRIGKNCSIGNSNIGMFSYIGNNSFVNNCETGKYCSIGVDFKIGIGRHPVNYLSTSPVFYIKDNVLNYSYADENHFDEYKKSYIGNDVWIGASVFVAEGVKIGDGAVIGAGAVVTKDVPPYTVVAGVPAKIIRYRFSCEIIEKILEIEWWNKDTEWIKNNIRSFQKPLSNIENLKI